MSPPPPQLLRDHARVSSGTSEIDIAVVVFLHAADRVHFSTGFSEKGAHIPHVLVAAELLAVFRDVVVADVVQRRLLPAVGVYVVVVAFLHQAVRQAAVDHLGVEGVFGQLLHFVPRFSATDGATPMDRMRNHRSLG